jgi:putative ABC transport system permease protein
MVMAPKSESLMNGGNGLPRRFMPLMYMHPEVVSVADLDGDGAMFQSLDKGPDGKKKREYVQLMVVDLHPGSVTLPRDYGPDAVAALSEPYAIAADETSLGRLGLKLGDRAIINGKIVRLRYILTGYANVNQPMITVSRDTLRMLGLASTGERVGPMMIKIRDPARAEIVRDQLNASGKGQYRAWTREELAKANERALMKEQIIGVMMNFTIALGFMIGIGITWQTLRGAIMSNIKEFASLRALGVSMGALRRIVIELAFWVGVTGLVTTAGLVWGVSKLGQLAGVPMAFPLDYLAMVVVMLMLIALGSGFLSLGVLKKSQPADLLR